MFQGDDILEVAKDHIGEEYLLGAIALLANNSHREPWDCAEFASWCAYQAYGIIYAVRPPDPSRGESYSGWWFEDAYSVGRKCSIEVALGTPGAILVRKPRPTGKPRIGHVAISIGDDRTIEAKDQANGVGIFPNAADRLWDIGVLLPGINYKSGAPIAARMGTDVLRFSDTFVRGPNVARLQRALSANGYDPGGIDGVFGPKTDAAVVNWQIKSGLVADGWVGKETAASLSLSWPILPEKEDFAALAQGAAVKRIMGPSVDSAISDLEPRPAHADPVPLDGRPPPKFKFENTSGKTFAIVEGVGDRFYVGYSVPYADDMARRGLAQKLADLGSAARFDAATAASKFGKWAYFLSPTIEAESAGFYGRVNSYDRAAFTFGCYQFAAHTPEANLILLFRKLLQLPDAASYFPDLALKQRADGNSTVHRKLPDGTFADLEVARVVTRPNGVKEKQLPEFMRYLNPDPTKVDKEELEVCARLMLWIEDNSAAQDVQLELAIETAKKKLALAKSKIPELEYSDWRIAVWVNDILHQGRGKYTQIASALKNQDPLDALSRIGATHYDGRKRTVQKSIDTLIGTGALENWKPD